MKNKIKRYITKWESKCYKNGIPDSAPLLLEENGRVPSYRLICKAILKNDKNLELLGYQRSPCCLYTTIKQQELVNKNKILPPDSIQTRLL